MPDFNSWRPRSALLLPMTDAELDPRWANVGTFARDICFFLGVALLLPVWRVSAEAVEAQR